VAVSGNEVQLAASCGVPAKRIVLNGNGKQAWELRLAVRLGCLVNVDSVFDIRRLVEVCREMLGDISDVSDDVSDARVRVLLRLNPDIDPVSICIPQEDFVLINRKQLWTFLDELNRFFCFAAS